MKQLEKHHLLTAVITHAGMSGKNNEDRYSISAFEMEDDQNTPALLAVMADGIGGHRAGEIAADIVVKRIPQVILQSSPSDPARTLIEAMHLASREIFEDARTNTRRQGMGATCAIAWIIGNNLYTATVGDSRIYLIRDRAIQQISIDHTWLQEALDLGLLKPEQALNHPNAHVIRRYMGSPNPPEVDIRMRLSTGESDRASVSNQGLSLRAEDHVLLCSDGLTDLVNDLEILKVFRQQASLEDAVQSLINLANIRGGFDNITIIAIKVPASQSLPGKKRSKFFPFLAMIGRSFMFSALARLVR